VAAKKGLALDAEGLRRGRRVVASKRESDIYAALGLPYIEPELRESGEEIRLALHGRLPDPVSDEDIRGILHAHTDLSDGANTLEQMAEATRARGYAYFGVADHSQSAGYAGGLSVEEIAEQHAAIARLNARFCSKFRVFKGIESDILPDGSLDYPAAVSIVSISSSPACTADFGWDARSKRNASFAPSPIPIRRSSAT
jgi:DNA polymerase (family 10)